MAGAGGIVVMRALAVALALIAGIAAPSARAADCPGNPDALGVSRTIVVDPREHARIGTMQYEETLPLAEKEVVLTFDDGPIPPYTPRILDILASECVKATYFLVGEMAKLRPELVRRIAEAGHSVGTHTQTHPNRGLRDLPLARGLREINDGIASAAGALGGADALAPFFRYSGFGSTPESEEYLASRGIQVWGADFPADDWKRISDKEIVRRAMQRLAGKGKGILLLHDIHPATVLALPQLFRELKAGGYRIVHVVWATPDRPKTMTQASDWLLHPPVIAAWPPTPRMLAGRQRPRAMDAIEPFGPDINIVAPLVTARRIQVAAAADDLVETSVWPAATAHLEDGAEPVLPQPDVNDLGVDISFSDAIGLRPALEARAPETRLRHSARAKIGHHMAMAEARPTGMRRALAQSGPLRRARDKRPRLDTPAF